MFSEQSDIPAFECDMSLSLHHLEGCEVPAHFRLNPLSQGTRRTRLGLRSDAMRFVRWDLFSLSHFVSIFLVCSGFLIKVFSIT